MVHKSKLISLTLFTLSIFLLILFFKTSFACHLYTGTWFTSCNSGAPCSYDSQCGSGPKTLYDFTVDLGGCTMACAAGQYYAAPSCPYGTCVCSGPEAKWYDVAYCENKDVCKRRSGWSCGDWIREGVWDESESKCVVCNGAKEKEYFDCKGDYSGNGKCESACGADSECDEKNPGDSLPDKCSSSNIEVNRYCGSDCKVYGLCPVCSQQTCGSSVTCGGQTYYCVYQNGKWQWSTTKPSGFCCSDNDCKAAGVTCDAKGYPNRYARCADDHTCTRCGPCETRYDCKDTYCCDKEIDVSFSGQCKSRGDIVPFGGKSYLCTSS